MVKAQTLQELAGSSARGTVSNLHVRGTGKLFIGYPDKITLAEVFDIGDLPLQGGYLVFDFVDDLLDGIFLSAIINNECGAVVTVGLFHWCLCD